MKLSKLSMAILGCASLAAGVASAADAPAAPKLGDVLAASGITVTGYVDAAYTHFDASSALQPLPLNYFDESLNSGNTFNLKQAAITIAKQPSEGFGALVNVTAGSDADWIKSAPYSTGSASNSYDLTQAFVQYAGSGFTVMGGKFNTLAGAEVIAPNGNTNISRSIAFLNAIPFTHTGVRVSYAPNSMLTLYAGSLNGWDQQKDMNAGKTTELGVSYTPVDMFSFALYGYSGQEGTPGSTVGRTLLDAVVTIKPIKPLAIIINYDSGKDKDALPTGDAKWKALNAYVNYQFTDKLRGSLRMEEFKDPDGYKLGYTDLTTAATAEKIKEVTLTVGYAPVDSFELRGEVRQDKADQEVYVKDGSPTDKQTYVAVEGLYKF